MESLSNGSNKQVVFKEYFHRFKKNNPRKQPEALAFRSYSAVYEDTVPVRNSSCVKLSISVGKYKKASNSQLCRKPLQCSAGVFVMMGMLCPLMCKKNVHLSNFRLNRTR